MSWFYENPPIPVVGNPHCITGMCVYVPPSTLPPIYTSPKPHPLVERAGGVWLIPIEERHGGHSVLGPYHTLAAAKRALTTYVNKHYGGRGKVFDDTYTDEYGSSLACECFYSEDETIAIEWREIEG